MHRRDDVAPLHVIVLGPGIPHHAVVMGVVVATLAVDGVTIHRLPNIRILVGVRGMADRHLVIVAVVVRGRRVRRCDERPYHQRGARQCAEHAEPLLPVHDRLRSLQVVQLHYA